MHPTGESEAWAELDLPSEFRVQQGELVAVVQGERGERSHLGDICRRVAPDETPCVGDEVVLARGYPTVRSGHKAAFRSEIEGLTPIGRFDVEALYKVHNCTVQLQFRVTG